MTFRKWTLSQMAEHNCDTQQKSTFTKSLGIMTLSITTLSITTLNITKLSITTFSITTFSRKKLSIINLFSTLSINDTQHK
jgi:hypothetical protein